MICCRRPTHLPFLPRCGKGAHERRAPQGRGDENLVAGRQIPAAGIPVRKLLPTGRHRLVEVGALICSERKVDIEYVKRFELRRPLWPIEVSAASHKERLIAFIVHALNWLELSLRLSNGLLDGLAFRQVSMPFHFFTTHSLL